MCTISTFDKMIFFYINESNYNGNTALYRSDVIVVYGINTVIDITSELGLCLNGSESSFTENPSFSVTTYKVILLIGNNCWCWSKDSACSYWSQTSISKLMLFTQFAVNITFTIITIYRVHECSVWSHIDLQEQFECNGLHVQKSDISYYSELVHLPFSELQATLWQ